MTDYYVSPTGTSKTGTSASAPFGAIEDAIAAGLKAGDTVHIMNGVYNPRGDNWTFRGISGTAANPITIQAYSGHTPQFSGSRAKPYSGWPTVTEAEYYSYPRAEYDKDGEYAQVGNKNLVFFVNCNHLVWDGVDVVDSLARGIVCSNCTYITIKNCVIGPNNHINLLLEGGHHYTLTDVEVKGSGSWWPEIRPSSSYWDWQASIACKANYITATRIVSHNNYGETFIVDANKAGSQYVTVQDSTFYDNVKSFFIQAARDVLVERCLFFTTQEGYKAGIDTAQPALLGILSEEAKVKYDTNGDRLPVTDRPLTNNVTIRNNYFIRGKDGINIRGSAVREILKNVYVYNNTISYCRSSALEFSVVNKSNIVLKNNIFNADASSKLASLTTNLNGVTYDNNVWSHDISATVDIADGTNDVYGDPGLANEAYWPTASDRATTFTQGRLTSGSNARGAGVDLSASFTDDHYGQTRSAWDAGAHEYDGNSALTATAAATNSPQPEGTAITFTGTAANGTSTYTYAWDFGDGATSTSQNPSHAYASAGNYTATLTITDSSDPVQTAVDTVDVSVLPVSAGTAAPVDVRQIVFNVGDASINPGITPKAILFVWGGGAANDTIVDTAAMGYGIWSDNGNQYAVYTRDTHGLATTDNVTRSTNTSAIMATSNIAATERFTGTVGAVSSSSVALSWTGTTSTGERVIAYVFGGSGVSNALASHVNLAWNGTATLSGDYSFLFVPASVATGAFDSAVGQHRISAGFAVKDGGAGTVGVVSRDNQSSADVRGTIRDDAIAAWSLSGSAAQVTIESWSGTGVTFRMNSASDMAGTAMPVLAMKLSGASASVDVVDLPTATGASDWALSHTPQISWLIATTLTEANAVATDTAAGQITWASTDGSDVDYTIGMSSKDAVTPTVTKSVTDADFSQLGSAGTVVNEGALSNETNATRLNLTTAAGTAYKALLVTIQATSTGDTPTAKFDVEAAPYYYDTAITFTDLSVSDGTHTTLSYSWDWGDGSTAGEDADMSGGGTGSGETIDHTYDRPGTFVVTLTVTDNNSDVDTFEKTIEVLPPEPTFDLAIDPTSGDLPLSVEVDASDSTAGGDEAFDTAGCFLNVLDEDGGLIYSIAGLTGTFVAATHGEYDVQVLLKYDGLPTTYSQTYKAQITATPTVTASIITPGLAGPFTAVGPFAIQFQVIGPETLLATATFAWDFTDDDADDLTSNAPTNTFAEQTSATTYDVVCTVTWGDGTTTVVTLTDWVTIIPAPRPPINLQTLYSNMDAYKRHLGILAGKTWTQENAPNSNVWRMALADHEWAENMTVRVVENGALLTAQASVAAAQAAAGSSHYTYGSGVLTVYVHPTTGDNPNTNGKNYRWVD